MPVKVIIQLNREFVVGLKPTNNW